MYATTERLTKNNHPTGGLNTLIGGILLNNIQIAIDGPAGAGKSTIAKKIAKSLDITYIDTGAMYRALTYKAIMNNVNIHNHEEIIQLAANTDININKGELYLDARYVKDEIRSQGVNDHVSYIAQIPGVRKILVKLQKKIALGNSVVMDGRDIGTFVLPDADIKIFLTASIEERAYRRYSELLKQDENIDLKDIEKSILERDRIDTEREYAPLVKAEDAIIIDTTGLNIDEVVEGIINLIMKKIKKDSNTLLNN